MGVSFWVGQESFEVGAASFLNCFFSTVVLRIENGNWGSRFPVLMKDLYDGELPNTGIAAAKVELQQIRESLAAALAEAERTGKSIQIR